MWLSFKDSCHHAVTGKQISCCLPYFCLFFFFSARNLILLLMAITEERPKKTACIVCCPLTSFYRSFQNEIIVMTQLLQEAK